jgi:NAD(P)-dependent dehydrogenase (short-subunit alcohol dehydrogenase family)
LPAGQAVLLVGGTGRTGRRVLEQLLERGVSVRAIVRSASRLPEGIADDPRLTVVEADILSLSGEDLVARVRGCDAVISCLGHVISIKGVLGPPHDLVTRATARLCQAIRDSQPDAPVKYILMSSVSVNHPGAPDARRGRLEKVLLWVLRGLLPPARDNQRAVDFLHGEIGASNPLVQWVAVRPDALLEGAASAYSLHEDLVSSIFKPDSTNMANVASFMCDLATDADTWDRWAGRLPVIVNGSSPNGWHRGRTSG